jgi:high affinity Mn2+ porin
MNTQAHAGDTGMSRYPPAEGERGLGGAPATSSSDSQGDAGVSRYPPAESERGSEGSSGSGGNGDGNGDGNGNGIGNDNGNASQGDAGVSRYPPAGGGRGSAGAPGLNDSDRFGDLGVSRYPPAEGTRGPGFRREPVDIGDTWYSLHEQATMVTQVHDVFPSPYMGRNSLRPREPAATSLTATLFMSARLFESDHNETQLIFDPELAGGTGFSGTRGIAGFPNGEITRVGIAAPTPYIARLYVRQTFGFGGEREKVPDAVDQVAGERDVKRLAVILGKFALPDIADDNRYAHDPRTQFLNWALVYNGAWDYPANVRGYTYGLGLDYNYSKGLSMSYAVAAMPAVANGAALDPRFLKAQGQVAEIERRYDLFGRPGTIRPLAFLNHAHMGNYNEAVELMPKDPDITKTRSYRYKYGFGLNIDQELTDNLGFFSRLGWNDGHSETFAFTEIDRTLSAGLVMGGRAWARPYDRVGLAGILNGISGPHRAYLEHGGFGFIIGDGKLDYGPEEILELYYAFQIKNGLAVTFDFQEIGNPAYNRDRGPVSVFSLRVHLDR